MFFRFFLIFLVFSLTSCSKKVSLQDLDKLHNSVRKNPLIVNEDLQKVAYSHCEWMAVHDKLSHIGFNNSTISERVAQSNKKFMLVGENIGYNQGDVNEMFESWMKSPGHKRNILNRNFKYIGYAFVENDKFTYFCVVFSD